ncbi:single-stranded-DNA-specific exonuclease RecJ [PVC group bacterium]|nr:single-stranded-DNA-specific exonuclease RecJ [PVC group bacterium]
MITSTAIPKKWVVRDYHKSVEEELSKALRISKITSSILVHRGIKTVDTVRKFLNPQLTDFHDPFLLYGMKEACSLIRQAIDKNSRMLVYGDYDVDGVTSTVLILKLIRLLGGDVIYYVPNRLQEGYGLSRRGIDFANDEHVKLLITVDCGITAVREVEYANRLGIKTIIIDHHLPEKNIPEQCVIVNPKQPKCVYPFKDLCGVGLALKLSQAFLGIKDRFLDLAAFGTVADIVPLVDENRIIVTLGLRQMTQTANLGLQELVQVSSLAGKSLVPHHIGFVLGPRVNAAGRLGDARWGIELLLSENKEEAARLAQKLDEENNSRKKIEFCVLEDAIKKIQEGYDFDKNSILVLHGKQWHFGVIGIVASKLMTRFYRPVVLLSGEDEEIRGSARSIEEFNIHNALESCKDLLLQFGGHAYAAGLSLKVSSFEEFSKRINDYGKLVLKPEDLMPSLHIDNVLDIHDITFKLTSELEQLAPFGTNNHRPLFMSERVKIKSEPQLLKNEHIKFWVSRKPEVLELIGFNMGMRYPEILKYQEIDIVYTISINEWRGKKSIQLQLKDFRPS